MKLLLLAHCVPHPPDSGARIRAHHILRLVAERATVYLGCVTDEAVSADSRRWLDRVCAEVRIERLDRRGRRLRGALLLLAGRTVTEGLFRSPSLLREVRGWARRERFDRILVDCSSMAPYVERAGLADTATVVDLVDVDSQKWLDYAGYAAPPMSWLFRREGRLLRELERELAAQASAVSVVSAAEADLLRSFCAADRIVVAPNGVDLDYFRPLAYDPPRDAPRCVFVGALDYRANLDGLHWFCEHVLPELRRRLPGASLRILGRRPGAAARRLASLPGVDLVGEVADVRPGLAPVTAAVAPLRLARGIQNKILEAMAMAMPVIASPQAAAGLGPEGEPYLVRADSPQGWVESIAHLHSQPERARELGARGRVHVERHHRWESCLGPLLAELGLAPPAAAPADPDAPRVLG